MSTLDKEISVGGGDVVEGAVALGNIKRLRKWAKEMDQAQTTARELGFEKAANQLETVRTGLVTKIDTDVAGVSNRVTNLTTDHQNFETWVRAQFDAMDGLSDEDKAAHKAAIERAINNFIDDGGLTQLSAQMQVVLNGTTVRLPDAMLAVWSIPYVESRETLGYFDDHLPSSIKFTFTDGTTSVVTATRNDETSGQIDLTYGDMDFRGLGIAAIMESTVTVDADGDYTLKKLGDLVFTISVKEGSAVTINKVDVDGDGDTETGDVYGDDTVPADDGGDLAAPD
ncbi:MAG: hypothetical protein ACWA40_07275 [Planktomarina sp.]